VAARTDILDLGHLGLSAGDGRRLELSVAVEPVELAGQHYEVGGPVGVVVDVSRTMGGWSLRVRAEMPLDGPCMRCLERAERRVAVDAREVDQAGGGEELESPYVDEAQLDLRALTRDSLVLALPTQIVCRDECRGLCVVCGENLNEVGEGHAHEPEPDPRWAPLADLRLPEVG
jgi:uncharacterized protein